VQRNQRSPANENMRKKLKSLARQSRQINLITPNWLRAWQMFPLPSQLATQPPSQRWKFHMALKEWALATGEMGMKLYKWFKQNISVNLLDVHTNFIASVFAPKLAVLESESFAFERVLILGLLSRNSFAFIEHFKGE